MGDRRNRGGKTPRTFMVALAGDVRANTLALMTMALIPLAGMIGGAIDISRMYIVKTRLQHACDAGALAGRKAMSSGTWGFNNYAARGAAETFFNANYNSNAYGVTSVTKEFTENAGKVMGTASAVLPMTLMRIFGRTDETLTVACDAEMRLPNTDIMFVLDTTGSMADPDGTGTTKIAGLRVAVKCFYEIVARLDTDADCIAGAPSGGTGNQVQIRFGFMPYSYNVNVGKLLPVGWFADSWTYQSRTIDSAIHNWTEGTTTASNPKTVWKPAGPKVTDDVTKSIGVTATDALCKNATNQPTSGVVVEGTPETSASTVVESNNTRTTTYTVTVPLTKITYSFTNGHRSGTDCRYDTVTTTGTRTTTYTKVDKDAPIVTWKYAPTEIPIARLKNGSEWNSTFKFTLPIGNAGVNKTITWAGCIEERRTEATTNYDPIPDNAYDLDIDMVPTSDPDTQWKPFLPQVIYTRRTAGNWTLDPVVTTDEYPNNAGNTSCPTSARRLQSWPDATAFSAYVNSLKTDGSTYHDIGLLWGARFASPTGIFAEDNDFTEQGGEIERHIIFMTDGATNAPPTDYNAYGIPWFDRRQTDKGTVPTKTQLEDQVNLRFAALCTKIRNTNKFTLWVISFGALGTATETRLRNCATPGRYYSALDSTALQTTFKSIADQISQLRLTK